MPTNLAMSSRFRPFRGESRQASERNEGAGRTAKGRPHGGRPFVNPIGGQAIVAMSSGMPGPKVVESDAFWM